MSYNSLPDPISSLMQAEVERRMVSSPGEASSHRVRMEPTCLIDEVLPLARNLRGRVVGQDEAVDSLVCSFARLLSGLRDPSRPLLTALLLGPTGVGKTETARALAQTLFGSDRSMIRVNSEEYGQGHEISKLLGSPPGYVGHTIQPLLHQERIDEPHRRLREEVRGGSTANLGLAEKVYSNAEDEYVSVLLFDEIEKAHPTVWNALLGILEDGTLTLGDNSATDFTRSIILMTSNAGSAEMSELLEDRKVGFGGPAGMPKTDAPSVRDVALAFARQMFPVEFLNRFDEILVYSPLEPEHLGQIFDKFLADIQDRALRQAGVPLLIKVSPEARQHIIDHGTDLRYGARPLRRAMERELVDPLSRFIASRELKPGDVVDVETEAGLLTFFRNLRASSGKVIA